MKISKKKRGIKISSDWFNAMIYYFVYLLHITIQLCLKYQMTQNFDLSNAHKIKVVLDSITIKTTAKLSLKILYMENIHLISAGAKSYISKICIHIDKKVLVRLVIRFFIDQFRTSRSFSRLRYYSCPLRRADQEGSVIGADSEVEEAAAHPHPTPLGPHLRLHVRQPKPRHRQFGQQRPLSSILRQKRCIRCHFIHIGCCILVNIDSLLNPLTPRRTLVSPFTEISILF